MSKRYAVIDIGTRGVRLLIADASAGEIERVVYSTGELGKLGRGAKSTGCLSTEAIEKVKEIVSRYVEICEQQQIDELVTIGTEVVRTAKNQSTFLKKLAPVVEVKLLKPQEEAMFSFLAVADAFCDRLQPGDMTLVVDQGGGSTELCCGSVEEDGSFVLRGFDTLRIGTVALTELLTEAKTVEAGYHHVMDFVQNAVKNHQKFNALKGKEPVVVFGLGSAITTLARQLNSAGKGRQTALQQVHGYFVPKKDMELIIRRVQDTLDYMPKSEFKNSGLAIDSILATLFCGTLTYYYIIEKYNSRGVIVSRRGLSYGVLLWLAGKTGQISLA